MSEGKYQKEIAEISKTIYSYCLSKTSTPEDAEDLSQDILLELTRSVKNIRDENAFYAFMWGVAGNVYKQWYRKKLKNTTYELPENIPSEDQLFSEEDSKYLYLLRRELTLLSAKYRKATISYYIENHSCAEIANLLSISESMVKYLLFKSRKILKEGMNRQYNQDTTLLIAENLSDYIVSSFEIRQYTCIPRLHNQKNFLAMSRRFCKITALFSGAAPDRGILSYCERRATKSMNAPFLQKSIVL